MSDDDICHACHVLARKLALELEIVTLARTHNLGKFQSPVRAHTLILTHMKIVGVVAGEAQLPVSMCTK
jgi:hypothetical protein